NTARDTSPQHQQGMRFPRLRVGLVSHIEGAITPRLAHLECCRGESRPCANEVTEPVRRPRRQARARLESRLPLPRLCFLNPRQRPAAQLHWFQYPPRPLCAPALSPDPFE